MRTLPGLVAIPLALLAALPAHAAGWFTAPTPGMVSRAPRWREAGELPDAARVVIQQSRDALGLAGVELEDRQTLRLGRLGTVRFRQLHQGLPVRDASVVVRLDDGGAVHAVVVDVARGLSASAVPTISAAAARALVGRLLSVDAVDAPAELGFERADQRGGLLAWYVDAEGPTGPRRWVVDAHRGTLLGQLALTTDVVGRVYPINPSKTPATSDVVLPDLTPSVPQYLVGAAGALRVHNYVSGTISSALRLEQKTTSNVGDDFLYDPLRDNNTLTDPFAEVNLYYHLMRVRDFFSTRLSVDMKAARWALLAVSNYGPDMGYYDNAFFTIWRAGSSWPGGARNAIVVGNGRGGNFAYDSDIILHEFTHYVNHNAIGFSYGALDFDEYGSVIMPSAINEGTADYFSSSLNNDPVVGEGSLGAGARDLSAEGPRCPEGLTGEPHADGQTVASVAWAIRAALGAATADRLVWAGLTMVPDRPTFGDLGSAMMQAAASLELDAAQTAKLAAALGASGITDCNRFLPVGPRTRSVPAFGLNLMAWQLGTSCDGIINDYGFALTSPFQFTHTPAPDDKAVTFYVTLKTPSGRSRLSWNLFARAGSPVTFVAPGGHADTFDHSTTTPTGATLTGTSAELVIDANSDPPFDPQATYYLAIGHQNCGSTVARVTASNMVPMPDMAVAPDMARRADMGALAGPEGGCACSVTRRTTPASHLPGLILLVAAGAFALARRKR